MKTILCYGDSNTWGYIPGTGERYGHDIRWPGILARELGPGYRIIEEALNGRTTVWDDPIMPGRNGAAYLAPCLDSHRPLDQIILFLGLNDLKRRFSAPAQDIAKGVGLLLGIIARSGAGVQGKCPPTLVVSPPHLGKLTAYAESFEDAVERSKRIACWLEPIVRDAGCEFLNIAEHAAVSDDDGLHFDQEAHAAIGIAVAERIRRIQG